MTEKQERVRWILNDSVCVIDGWCWAIASNLKSVCIGKEADLKELKNDKPQGN